MGLIRFLLAMAVVLTHTIGVNTMIGGQVAVQSFFIISGFYIAFILNEKYTDYRDFLINRILKIYPLYWVVLLLSVAVSFIGYQHGLENSIVGNLIMWFNQGEYSLLFVSLFMNIFILGIDLYHTYFFEHLNIFQHFGGGGDIFIVQAWTLSLEVLFYCLSIFLVKLNKIKISLILIVLLVTRFYVNKIFGYNEGGGTG